MTIALRYATVTNPSADTPLTNALVDKGQDYVFQLVRRKFKVGDLGEGPGQTHDQSDPTVGCLIGQFKGAPILAVMQAYYHPGLDPYQNFNFETNFEPGANQVAQWRVDTDEETGLSSLYIYDRLSIIFIDDIAHSLLIRGNKS